MVRGRDSSSSSALFLEDFLDPGEAGGRGGLRLRGTPSDIFGLFDCVVGGGEVVGVVWCGG